MADDDVTDLAPLRPRVADSLDRAESGQLVYAGRDGSIIPAARARRRTAAVLALAGASFAAGVAVSIAYFPVMLIPYALIGARAAVTIRATRRLNEVAVMMQDDRPAKNVFAAGEVMAGNILGRGYLAGFGLTIGSVFGRIAGREAARCAGY